MKCRYLKEGNCIMFDTVGCLYEKLGGDQDDCDGYTLEEDIKT